MRGSIGALVAAVSATAAGLFFLVTPPGHLLEARTVDARTRLLADRSRASDRIVLIDIDESSLRALEPAVGRWPWPREVHGLLVDALAFAGARVVLYDVFFAGRDRGHPEADLRFAESLRAAGNVVLAASGEKQPLEPESLAGLVRVAQVSSADRYPGLLMPFSEATAAARATAPVNIAIDEDGVLRRAVASIGYRSDRLASAPLVAASVVIGSDPRFEGRRLMLGGRTLRLDRQGRICLRFRGAPNAYRHQSFVDVFAAWGAHLQGRSSPFDWSVFRDRAVIVTATASGLFDQHAGPFAGEYPGGELLATTLDDLVSGDALDEVSPSTAGMLVAGAAVAGAASVFGISALAGLAAGSAVICGYLLVTLSVFRGPGLVLPVLGPVVAAATALGLGSGYRYFTEGRERRRIHAIFSRYVSDRVAARLIEQAGALELGGAELEVSVLFCDIRDFTTWSERLSPSELVRQLNEYFGALTEAVLAEDGTIDKFIGDAIMAVFGAPLAQPDHARRAIAAAVGMTASLERLNEQWREQGRPEWSIGIGIATGPAIVGNVGSVRRTEFTVIGDTVNLASRLEGQNKALGTCILVSAETARVAGDGFPLEPRGEIQVKGKERSVAVFSVAVGPAGGMRK